MTRYFHFTLGPVQGFVAQARRTRDFWAGSFILSYLSAVAMRAVQRQPGSTLRFPQPDKAFLAALESPPPGYTGPSQGSVPNRFMAEVGDGFDPELVTQTVAEAWRALADVIWRRDLSQVVDIVDAPRSKLIWDRQVTGFWEIYWAITDRSDDTAVLDRRKNWRHHLPPDEPGVKCLVMDGWQELSGALDPRQRGPFWATVRRRCGYTLGDGETLCAMAFIKRRFARHFHHLRAPMPGGWTLHGWKVPTAVPSSAYLANAPWLALVIKRLASHSKPIDRFLVAANRLIKAVNQRARRTGDAGYGERQTELKCIRDAENATQPCPMLRSLDGDLFSEGTLENPRFLREDGQPGVDAEKKDALEALKALHEAAKKKGIDPPSPFYAVLMMDGDALGKQMAIPARQRVISAALKAFTSGVKAIVDDHSGFLVYAGGDDVLATLPLDYALPCARALRTHYLASFEQASAAREHDDEAVCSTLSGAIEFAHVRVPLTRVLGDAHKLLDDVAKDGRGRDALAIRVWTPGGPILEWSMPWAVALEDRNGVETLVIESLTNELRRADDGAGRDSGDGGDGGRPFSGSFFHRIRALFTLLNPRDAAHDALTPEDTVDLMTAEYVTSGVHDRRDDPRPSTAAMKPVVQRLLDQCRPVTRRVDGDTEAPRKEWPASTSLYADGALLVRFLAEKGLAKEEIEA